MLSSKGIWVRKRDGKWEAKGRINHQTVPLETSCVNSQFQELSDPVDIARVVHSIFPLDNNTESTLALSPSTCFGLSPMARFITYREAWKVDGRFNVVFDTTDFGHTFGEVELEKPAVFDLGEVVDPDELRVSAMRHAVATEADAKIEEFMRCYFWAFPPGKPMGKLSAFFARQ